MEEIKRLKKPTKLTTFEKICLCFIKKKVQINDVENNTLIYKIFRGKVYIINHFITPPKCFSCRHNIINIK